MLGAEHPVQIGKFPVVRRVGVGAMGEVFLCTQPELDRPVAVKVMRGGPTQWPRFQREARSAARLVHPYIIRVYDVGQDYESPYIVMEFVDGQPLSELIGSNELTLPVILRLLYHVTEALDAAHAQSIIHRDLKPSNILIDTQGRPRLTDFGLAKSLLHDPVLSGSGDLVGTPRYMAPEQILGDNQELDQRVDVFALGVVMYEMLAGRPPFDGANVVQILRQVTDDDPPDLVSVNPSIPEQVAAISRKAMSKHPDDRFQTAAEMGAALRSVLLNETMSSSDGGLKANEYLSTFVPLAMTKPHRRSWINPTIRTVIGIAGGLLLIGILTCRWWWPESTEMPLTEIVQSETEPSEIDDFGHQKALLLQEVEQALRGELRVPQQKTPRDVLKEDLDEATALLKRNPSDDELRLARARLLRRAGECLAADAECTTVLQHQPELLEGHVERLLARTQLWGLYLGGWDDKLVRYPVQSLLVDDTLALRKTEDPVLLHVARLADRLRSPSNDDLLTVIRSSPAESHALVPAADIAALHVELLFREAEDAEISAPTEGDARPTFGVLADAAKRQLRTGLAADPHHVGLLFLRAASYSRRAGWEDANGGEDREACMKRSLSQFSDTIDRLRRVTLRQGCDTPIAFAVLLTNMGWSSSAADHQLQDALSCRPTVPHLHAVRTWFRILSPDDGTHTPNSLKQLATVHEQTMDDSDERAAYLVQAVLKASLGQFAEARRPLRLCRSKFPKTDGWLALQDEHQRWLDSADKCETLLLYETRHILAQLPIAPDVAVELHTALLKRLDDKEIVTAENLSESTVKNCRAGTHFSFAEIHAGLGDKGQVLEHLREALEQRSAEISVELCRDHWVFSDWNDDDAFQQLYRQFSPSDEAVEPRKTAATPEGEDATSK